MATAVGDKGSYPLIDLRVLALTRYGELGASSRLRFLQYLPRLYEDGIQVEVSPFFDDDALRARYLHGSHHPIKLIHSFRRRVDALLGRRRFDLLWIEKECLPWAPLWLERRLLRGVPYLVDLDDAIFHRYDDHSFKLVRSLLGARIDRLMRASSLVVGGNAYLADRARRAGSPSVEVLPTVIDLARYPVPRTAYPFQARKEPGRLVWIGSPSTVHYLKLLAEPLRLLATRVPFTLRVIGATLRMPGVDVEEVAWRHDTEVASIAECDAGLMPLVDSPWERGKCGYKLVQYMACSLPVVASPVGVNAEIVSHGSNGFLAESADEWVLALGRLLKEPELRQFMGQQGRHRVESAYCLQVTAPRLSAMLRRSAAKAL